ncbi:MAG: hypothetical protein JNN20_15280 [Betaproteobacteria bacterium]|nr:hypothetical protein [Betaproteobacteria bacterium]
MRIRRRRVTITLRRNKGFENETPALARCFRRFQPEKRTSAGVLSIFLRNAMALLPQKKLQDAKEEAARSTT